MRRAPDLVTLPLIALLAACGSDTETPSEDEVAVDVAPVDTGSDAADAGADVSTDSDADAVEPEVTTDLVPWSRLDAPLARTGERVDDLRNGPGSIRDGDASTGWLAPPLGGRLVVDWQPWIGTPVTISSVALELESPVAVDVRLLDGCGGAVLWQDSSVGGSTVFDVGQLEGACLEVELEEGRVTALRVEAAGEYPPPPVAIGVRDPIDILYPSFGVFEGHSGPLWSWHERESLVRAHALHGLGTYVYAPENDLYRSSDWRTPYPAEWLEEFEALATLAVEMEFGLTYGISPFADWLEGDTETLLGKLQSIADTGVSSFVLMGDGVEPSAIDADLATVQVAVSNAIVSWMNDAELEGEFTMVPSVVTESLRNGAADGGAYLAALSELPETATVLWSGAESFNETFDSSELAAVGVNAGFLDTFWAGPALRLGTYSGRDNLQGEPIPVWIRTGARPGIARFNLHQFAHWTQQRAGGPEGARDFAAVVERRWGLREIENDADSELLNEIARAFDGAGPEAPRYDEYEDVIDSLVADLADGAPTDRAVQDALTQFAEMAAVRSVVWHSTLAPELVDDLWLGLDYIRVEGERGLWALTELRERLGGRETADAEAELDLLNAALTALPADTSPDAFDGLYEAVQATNAVEDGPESLLFYEPPERCFAQSSLGWTPFPDATWMAVAGLPGATVDGDFIQWFAENAGEYRAVIVATAGTPTTWNFRIVDIACEPES